jgi:hypothetical protein
LEKLDAHQAAQEIRDRWNELIALAGETKPARYDVAYPQSLLVSICDMIYQGCQALGLAPWSDAAGSGVVVGPALDAAWTEFRLRPATFEGYEATALTNVLSKCTA